MNVHLEHVQDDIFVIIERVLGNGWEILRGCRNWRRNDFGIAAINVGNEDITILNLNFATVFLELEAPLFSS